VSRKVSREHEEIQWATTNMYTVACARSPTATAARRPLDSNVNNQAVSVHTIGWPSVPKMHSRLHSPCLVLL
jgi:hypothetical protein